MSDAIIVLGRGVNDDGTLPVDPQARVRTAANLYKQGVAPLVVMSGAWSYHYDLNPQKSEALAMKEYAITLGVPASAIIEESKSKDTIGNVYFTKKDVAQLNNFKSFHVVASEEHMPRIKYLFEKIYGPDYHLDFIESERVIDEAAYQKESAHEDRSMSITRKWLDKIMAGDDEAIREIMNTIHPAYNKAGHPAQVLGNDRYPDAP